jgi:hypothetical protein
MEPIRKQVRARQWLNGPDIYSITTGLTTVEHAYPDAPGVRVLRFGAFVFARRFPPGVGRLPVKSTVTSGGTQPASDALAASVPHSTCGSYRLTHTFADGFCPSKMVQSGFHATPLLRI